MGGLQDIWERFSSDVLGYFAQNPNAYGLLLAAFGVLFFVGAWRKWEWVLIPTHKFSILRSLFGQRGMVFIASVLMILFGLGYFFFL